MIKTFLFTKIYPLAFMGWTDLSSPERRNYVWGTIAGVVIYWFVMKLVESRIYKPLMGKAPVKKPTVVPPAVQNEMDYADYLAWAAQKGEQAIVKKKIIL